MKGFKDRVAAITGAASGIGRALAVELAKRGCHLALADVDTAGLDGTAALCAVYGVRIDTTRLDVSERPAVFDWAARTAAAHGKVNLIFNNAGVGLSAAAESVSISDFEWIMGINFWGVVHGTQAFMPHLRASGEGCVINTASILGIMAMPAQSPYNASKFAVRGFTESLRMDLESEGAPVSAVCVVPGGVATNIAQASRIDASATAVTGADAERMRRSAIRTIQGTTPESAAQQILRGVERDARRVVIGSDARMADLMVRLLGPRYQDSMVRQTRASRNRSRG